MKIFLVIGTNMPYSVLLLISVPASFVLVPTTYHPTSADIADGFTLCAWIQPFANTDGYILAKTNPDGSRHFYTLRVTTNSLQTQLVFGYSVTGANVSYQ